MKIRSYQDNSKRNHMLNGNIEEVMWTGHYKYWRLQELFISYFVLLFREL